MRSRVKFCLLLCLCFTSWANALSTTQWYVDPGVVAGDGSGTSWENAYASQSAFEAAEAADLTALDEIYNVNLRSLDGSDDTTTYRQDGFTLDSTRYLEYTGDSANGGDFPTDGKLDETKYIMHNNDSAGQMIECRDDYVRYNKIQFKVTSSGTSARRVFNINTINAGNDIRVSNCIIKGVISGDDTVDGILLNDADIIFRMYNTVIYEIFRSTDLLYRGVYIANCATSEINHCTIYGNSIGIQRDAGTVDVSSCIVGNNDNDASGVFNSYDRVCDDDDDGTNNQDPLNGSWTDELTAPAADDFTLKAAGASSVGNGADDPFGDGFGDPDLASNSRSSTWDIGAFEWVTVAGGQVIFINMN